MIVNTHAHACKHINYMNLHFSMLWGYRRGKEIQIQKHLNKIQASIELVSHKLPRNFVITDNKSEINSIAKIMNYILIHRCYISEGQKACKFAKEA